MVKGIFETHLNVANYLESAKFYEQLPGLESLHIDHKRKSSFFWVGGKGKGMLGIRENYPSSQIQRQHFAFEVEENQLFSIREELETKGIQTENFYGDDSGDLYVFTFMPAVSFYVTDPNGHSIEYLAMLDKKIDEEKYGEIIPYKKYCSLL
ncbi:VOC family protein [Enterococcus sp. DIV0242_7C1]|uniref:VOC domain-containing protein n=1 Tax=Candidatus Enterococcus dunnyi TaxID=1834192 RepID=A0A200JDP0_9ENTE|nr:MULTISPECIES: VOC family protein [unclassified Enterococcus]MBO0469750.1 VOC family protein [Enterococcus sp. DIV0242_7C1]OUZ34961.1 hypothetical protein A5889_000436 [Enterococcus sp. 9D6_DIV0238]